MIELPLDTGDLNPSLPIQTRLLNERERMEVLPTLFGAHMLRYEAYVFGWMRKLAIGYDGAYWDMYQLSNGGFYMSPNWPAHYQVSVESNGFEGDLSADAAGIVVNLFALNQLIWEHPNEAILKLYDALRGFAAEHAEASLIFRAID